MINGAERLIKESEKLGNVREKSGNFEIMNEWQPCLVLILLEPNYCHHLMSLV